MNISLEIAKYENLKKIHEMQIIAFKPLLYKYQDYDMSPGNEKFERIEERFMQDFTDYYLIRHNAEVIGAIRIIRNEVKKRCRVSPLFILPDYQGRGIAQDVFRIIEEKYNWANSWELDTIKEEAGSCHLYEKVGYIQTGKSLRVNENMTIVFYEKDIVREA